MEVQPVTEEVEMTPQSLLPILERFLASPDLKVYLDRAGENGKGGIPSYVEICADGTWNFGTPATCQQWGIDRIPLFIWKPTNGGMPQLKANLKHNLKEAFNPDRE